MLQLAFFGESFWASFLFPALSGLVCVCLPLPFVGAAWTFGRLDGAVFGILCFHVDRFFRAVILCGSVCAGSVFLQGHWCCPAVTFLVFLFARNLSLLALVEAGFFWFSLTVVRVTRLLRRTSQAGSHGVILVFYGLGILFFQ
ncbi:hypothetical protein [Shewanella sp. 38A_GOM-205m]|uniref:hypothetical protein n=1 Tax=Shewanella sp. 38A_GOM-205m TaxID=1380363 RepID=UPI0012DC08DF|nr:hypothetical protein [Shewanella sp. 38A_GOM-205m]